MGGCMDRRSSLFYSSICDSKSKFYNDQKKLIKYRRLANWLYFSQRENIEKRLKVHNVRDLCSTKKHQPFFVIYKKFYHIPLTTNKVLPIKTDMIYSNPSSLTTNLYNCYNGKYVTSTSLFQKEHPLYLYEFISP